MQTPNQTLTAKIVRTGGSASIRLINEALWTLNAKLGDELELELDRQNQKIVLSKKVSINVLKDIKTFEENNQCQ